MRRSGEQEDAGVASREFKHEGCCPACGRYVGPVSACPFCDCPVDTPGPVRVLRIAALLFATVGLGLFYLAARTHPVPTVRIERLTPFMNYACVRASGEVARTPYRGYRDGVVDYLSFSLTAHGAELHVKAYGDTARALAGTALPERGERVEVCGSLNVSSRGGAALRLRRPEDLAILDPNGADAAAKRDEEGR